MNFYFIGLDIAKDTFVASIYHRPKESVLTKENLSNDKCGYDELILWLKEHGITRSNCQVCLEATGVYSQGVSYYLTTQGYQVSEPPPLYWTTR